MYRIMLQKNVGFMTTSCILLAVIEICSVLHNIIYNNGSKFAIE